MMKYKVLTSVDALEINDNYNTDEELEEIYNNLYEEQLQVLRDNGFEVDNDTVYKIHYIEDPLFHNDGIGYETIKDSFECNAIKEGYNVVKFENGKIGVVASYNGNENGFEFLAPATDAELEGDDE